MDLGFEGKAAVVTGSSRGIGRAIARSLAAEGARVMLCARNEAGLEAARLELEKTARSTGGQIATCVADVCREEDRIRLINETLHRFGRLDVLVNNAGGSRGGTALETPLEDWKQVMSMNLWSGLELTRLAVPRMRETGGSILFISSIWGREAGGRPAYNAAKAAEISLAKALAPELAPWGIRVNALAPGSILFPGGTWERRLAADPEGTEAWLAREFPFARFGRPEEVADAAVFLCSERASWIHGACLVVDGGQSKSY